MAAVAALAISGCAATELSVDTSDTAEMTYDGLYPVKGSSADAAWARPDADISQYSKIMLEGVGIEYRPGGETRRLPRLSSKTEFFEMDAKQKARLEEVVRESMVNELSKSEHFAMVDEAGTDVLLVRIALLDVVSYVPPDPISNTDIYLSRVGEATMVLELRDSLTGTIIARSADRRAAENTAVGFSESNRVSNASEVRRVTNAWARKLRERLDAYGVPKD